MTSLVVPKPTDNPASPGQMLSFGSDPAALDDYLNVDLFSAAPPATRASQSPASSHGALPVTPNTAADHTTAATSPRPLFPALDASPGGSLAFIDSYTPLDKNFGAYPDLGMLPGSSMDLGMGSGLEQYSNLFQDMFASFADPGPSTDTMFAAPPVAPQVAPAPVPVPSSAIDPQLFTAPAPLPTPAPASTSSRAMTVDSDDDNSDEDEATQEDDEVPPLPTSSGRATRRPRKNAAAAGGIAKRPSRASTPASVVPSYVHFDDPKPVIPPVLGKGGVASYLNGERIGSQEPDEWRPTPEEYKKLSSKEKRQLRNKISARNFRVRRKEYITTLESHIADRDQLISAIRSELSSTHHENNELRREIDALKRAIQEGRLSAEATGLPPPRPLTPEATATTTTAARRPKDLARANTQKDLDSSARNFWGGAVGNGGVTSVHATFIPEVFPTAQPLSGKPTPVRALTSSPSSSSGPATPPSEGVNMNPLMNLSPLFASSKLPGSPAVNAGLDIMGDAFNQRTLDGFRAQLWGRMAKEAGARSVERERKEPTGMEGVELGIAPADTMDTLDSLFSFSPSSGSPDHSASSSSPHQAMSSGSGSPQQSSSSSPPQQTLSSSPSLSMLNSPTGLRSLLDGTVPPSLFQASSFGSGGFGAAFGVPQPTSMFNQQSASSAQARAMIQAQWLALQHSRQIAASTPNIMNEVNAQAAAKQPTATVTQAQRDTYLAHFAQAVVQQQQQQQQQQQTLGGFAKEVRPAYFTGSSGSGDKTKAGSEKKPVIAEKETKKGATPQQAALFATIASQTLLQRMGSAFWDAFSGTGPKSGGVDTDKVRRVLEGKAVVRVVDVEDEKRPVRRDVGIDALEETMRKLSVGPSSSNVCGERKLDMFSNLRGKK